MLEDLSDVLESHALHLWVAKVDANPSDETDASVKSKSSRGSSCFSLVLHSGQDSRILTVFHLSQEC